MKRMIILYIGVFFINCNLSKPPKYETYKGVEYVPCGDFYNGRLYIKNVHKFSINEIVEFAYCYTSQNNFEGLVIEDKYYPAPSFWSGKKKGNTLFKIQFSIFEISESDTEIYFQKEVTLALQNVNKICIP